MAAKKKALTTKERRKSELRTGSVGEIEDLARQRAREYARKKKEANEAKAEEEKKAKMAKSAENRAKREAELAERKAKADTKETRRKIKREALEKDLEAKIQNAIAAHDRHLLSSLLDEADADGLTLASLKDARELRAVLDIRFSALEQAVLRRDPDKLYRAIQAMDPEVAAFDEAVMFDAKAALSSLTIEVVSRRKPVDSEANQGRENKSKALQESNYGRGSLKSRGCEEKVVTTTAAPPTDEVPIKGTNGMSYSEYMESKNGRGAVDLTSGASSEKPKPRPPNGPSSTHIAAKSTVVAKDGLPISSAGERILTYNEFMSTSRVAPRIGVRSGSSNDGQVLTYNEFMSTAGGASLLERGSKYQRRRNEGTNAVQQDINVDTGSSRKRGPLWFVPDELAVWRETELMARARVLDFERKLGTPI